MGEGRPWMGSRPPSEENQSLGGAPPHTTLERPKSLGTYQNPGIPLQPSESSHWELVSWSWILDLRLWLTWMGLKAIKMARKSLIFPAEIIPWNFWNQRNPKVSCWSRTMASSIVLPILLSAQDKFLNGQWPTITLLDISSDCPRRNPPKHFPSILQPCWLGLAPGLTSKD